MKVLGLKKQLFLAAILNTIRKNQTRKWNGVLDVKLILSDRPLNIEIKKDDIKFINNILKTINIIV